MENTNSRQKNIKQRKRVNSKKLYKENLIKNFISSFLHYIQTQQKEIIQMIQKNSKIDSQLVKQFNLKNFLKKNHPKKNRLYSILQLKKLFLINFQEQLGKQQQNQQQSYYNGNKNDSQEIKQSQFSTSIQSLCIKKQNDNKVEIQLEKTCKFRPISSNYLNYINYMSNQLNQNEELKTDNRKIIENDISGDQKNTSIIFIQNDYQSQYISAYTQDQNNTKVGIQQCNKKLKNLDDYIQNSKQNSLANIFSDQNDSNYSAQFEKQSTSSTKDQLHDQNLFDCLYHNQNNSFDQFKVAKYDQKQKFKNTELKDVKNQINNSNQTSQTSLMIEIQNQVKSKNVQTVQNVNDLEKLILRVFALRFIRQDMYQYMMTYSKSQNPFSNFKYRQIELTNRIIKIDQ